MWTGFAVGLIIMAIGIGCKNEMIIGAFMAVGAIVFFAALIQAFIFYICPYCGYSLMNVRGAPPEHCPKCGKAFKEEQ